MTHLERLLEGSGNLRSAMVVIGYLAVGLVGGYLIASTQFGIKPFRPSVVVDSKNEWERIRSSGPVLAIDHESFAQRNQQQSNFAHTDGSRSDWVIVGSLTDQAPYASIQIARRTELHTTHIGLIQNLEQFKDLRAARRRFGSNYYTMSTRFGELRATTILVNADGIQKYCVGFHTPGSGVLFVKGLICSSEQALATPQAVACLINSVRFVQTRDEQALRDMLADKQKDACGASLLGNRSEDASNRI